MKVIIFILLFFLICVSLIRFNQTHKPSEAQIQQMIIACRKDDVDSVEKLLNNGYSVNYKDSNDLTPLYYATERNSIKVVNLLIKKNADLNIRNNIDFTPLHESCYRAHIEVVKLLIDNGADVNAKGGIIVTGQMIGDGGKHNNTPLHLAIMYTGKDYKSQNEIVELLIKSGANVNAINNEKQTPLYCATDNAKLDIIEILLKNGADINIQESNYGNTPLMNSVGIRWDKLVIFLIVNGANLDLTNKNGETALKRASNLPDTNKIIAILKKAETPEVQALIKEGKKEEVIKILTETSKSTPSRLF